MTERSEHEFDDLARSNWPTTREELIAIQNQLGATHPDPWLVVDSVHSVAGCFVCYPKKHQVNRASANAFWAAAVWLMDSHIVAVAVVRGEAMAPYEPGLLALREGPLLESALRRLPGLPEILLVNATGRDHPRRAGLATHIGARLSLPTVGVTRNPLLASGACPADARGAIAPLQIGEEVVGYWIRTKQGAPPLAVHAAWRTSPETAVATVMAVTGRFRTPEPLRQARRMAREARAHDS